VLDEAARRGLRAYDAVCPLVAKVHRQVERYHRDGRRIVLVGKAGHPEVEGTLGRLPLGAAFLAASVEEAAALPLDAAAPVAVAVQTTFSVEEAGEVVDVLGARFADLAEPPTSDICYATTNRQRAVRRLSEEVEAVIVVGEAFSSNARRLAEVASLRCPSVQLVADASGVDWSRLPRTGGIGVTAAASTPEASVTGIVAALAERYRLRIRELGDAVETTAFKPVAIG
jgi:4-hydroxy-3-methylbut-2-enyl diphosphate reductase